MIKHFIESTYHQGPPRKYSHEKVIELRKEGHSYDGIAILMNMHRSSVAYICQRAKLGNRRPCLTVRHP